MKFSYMRSAQDILDTESLSKYYHLPDCPRNVKVYKKWFFGKRMFICDVLVPVEDSVGRWERESQRLALVFVAVPCLPAECWKPSETACCPSVRDKTAACRPLAYIIHYQTMPYAPVGPLGVTRKQSRLAINKGRIELDRDQLDRLAHDRSSQLHSVLAKANGLHTHFKTANTEIKY